jgi:hypothetical protein
MRARETIMPTLSTRVELRVLVALVVGLLAFYSGVVWYNLANYFPVRGDEVLTMSASHKLATTGVLGSDLATGLYGAERRFFLNLPVQNLIQAPVFRVAGTGIRQARLPSLVAGVAVVTCTTWFALRSFGWSVAALTAVALVFWRSNLIGTEPRPPLLALGQSGRYDLVVVALLWATILLLQSCVVRPRRTTAVLVGVFAGLTVLTQFYGIAAIVLPAVAYVMRWGRAIWREAVPRWSALGFLLVVAPYGVLILLDLDAFAGQAALQGPRVQFFDPRFWFDNLANETSRYASVTEPSVLALGEASLIGPWMLWVGALPGIVPLIALSRGAGVDRALPWLTLAVPFAVLALGEQTKAVLYTSLIVPSLSLCLACGLDAVIRGRLFGGRWPVVVRVLRVTTAVLLVVLVGEGLRGYQFSLRESERVTPYLQIGRQLSSLMPDDGVVLGAWRWWWALADHRYFAVNGFWQQSQRVSVSGDLPSFREELHRKGASYLVVDRDFLADLDRTVAAYRLDAVRFVDDCSVVVGVLDDVTYGRIEVRRVSCAAGLSSNVPQ